MHMHAMQPECMMHAPRAAGVSLPSRKLSKRSQRFHGTVTKFDSKPNIFVGRATPIAGLLSSQTRLKAAGQKAAQPTRAAALRGRHRSFGAAFPGHFSSSYGFKTPLKAFRGAGRRDSPQKGR